MTQRFSPSTSAALLRPQFQSTPATFASRIAQPSASRWYSDAKAAEEPKKEEEKKAEDAAADPLAELKKQLEAKDAEARDWKVCFLGCSQSFLKRRNQNRIISFTNNEPIRTNACVLSPTSATSRIALSAK